MKRRVVVLVVVLCLSVNALPGVEPSRGQSESRPRVSSPLPFAEGEKLVYQVRYSKFIISSVVGKLTFTFDRSTEKPLTNHYWIRVDAISDGLLVAILGIEVKDVFESFLHVDDFGVARTRKNLIEGEAKTFQLAVFDREGPKVTFIERDLSRRDSTPRTKEKPTELWVQDIVSAPYYARTQPLKPGESFQFPLSDEGETYTLTVNVHPAEEVETPLGKFKAIKLEPLVFGEGRLIRKDGEMFVWVTDDERRVPVAARIKGGFGSLNVQLIDGAKPTAEPPAKQEKLAQMNECGFVRSVRTRRVPVRPPAFSRGSVTFGLTPVLHTPLPPLPAHRAANSQVTGAGRGSEGSGVVQSRLKMSLHRLEAGGLSGSEIASPTFENCTPHWLTESLHQ